jgi:hypothetical protein
MRTNLDEKLQHPVIRIIALGLIGEDGMLRPFPPIILIDANYTSACDVDDSSHDVAVSRGHVQVEIALS